MKRHLFLILGWVSLAIGLVGIFVPLLPTTPFAILSAYLFEKGSPRLHSWLLQRPVLGPSILEWEKNKVIRPKIKVLAISLIILSLSYPVFFKPISLWAKFAAGLIGLLAIGYIATRKSTNSPSK